MITCTIVLIVNSTYYLLFVTIKSNSRPQPAGQMVSQVGKLGSLPLLQASLLVLAADSFSQDARARVHTPAFSFSDILSVRRVENFEDFS